jgi:hypothetical protein
VVVTVLSYINKIIIIIKKAIVISNNMSCLVENKKKYNNNDYPSSLLYSMSRNENLFGG